MDSHGETALHQTFSETGWEDSGEEEEEEEENTEMDTGALTCFAMETLWSSVAECYRCFTVSFWLQFGSQ